MKKAILTFGLFSLMMVLTSFTSPVEIGGQTPPKGKPFRVELNGQSMPVDKNPLEIGGQTVPGTKAPLTFEIGGQTVPGTKAPLAIGGQTVPVGNPLNKQIGGQTVPGGNPLGRQIGGQTVPSGPLG